MARTDPEKPKGGLVNMAPFLTREDVARSRRETDGIVDRARMQADDLQTVTADLLRLIEEFKNG